MLEEHVHPVIALASEVMLYAPAESPVAIGSIAEANINGRFISEGDGKPRGLRTENVPQSTTVYQLATVCRFSVLANLRSVKYFFKMP